MSRGDSHTFRRKAAIPSLCYSCVGPWRAANARGVEALRDISKANFHTADAVAVGTYIVKHQATDFSFSNVGGYGLHVGIENEENILSVIFEPTLLNNVRLIRQKARGKLEASRPADRQWSPRRGMPEHHHAIPSSPPAPPRIPSNFLHLCLYGAIRSYFVTPCFFHLLSDHTRHPRSPARRFPLVRASTMCFSTASRR